MAPRTANVKRTPAPGAYSAAVRRRAIRSVSSRDRHVLARAADRDLADEALETGEVELARQRVADPVGGHPRRLLRAAAVLERRDRDDLAVAALEHLILEEAVHLLDGLGEVGVDQVQQIVDRTRPQPLTTDAREHCPPPRGVTGRRYSRRAANSTLGARCGRHHAKGRSLRECCSVPALRSSTIPATTGSAPSTAIAAPMPLAVPDRSTASTMPITTSGTPIMTRRPPLPASLRSLRVVMTTAYPFRLTRRTRPRGPGRCAAWSRTRAAGRRGRGRAAAHPAAGRRRGRAGSGGRRRGSAARAWARPSAWGSAAATGRRPGRPPRRGARGRAARRACPHWRRCRRPGRARAAARGRCP